MRDSARAGNGSKFLLICDEPVNRKDEPRVDPDNLPVIKGGDEGRIVPGVMTHC